MHPKKHQCFGFSFGFDLARAEGTSTSREFEFSGLDLFDIAPISASDFWGTPPSNLICIRVRKSNVTDDAFGRRIFVRSSHVTSVDMSCIRLLSLRRNSSFAEASCIILPETFSAFSWQHEV